MRKRESWDECLKVSSCCLRKRCRCCHHCLGNGALGTRWDVCCGGRLGDEVGVEGKLQPEVLLGVGRNKISTGAVRN